MNASAMPGPVLGPGPPGADILAPLGGGEKSGRGFAQLVPRLCVSLSWVLGFPPPLEFVLGDRLLEEAAGVPRNEEVLRGRKVSEHEGMLGF